MLQNVKEHGKNKNRKNVLHLWWEQFHCLISLISESMFTEICLPNAGGIAIQNVLVRF